MRDDIVASFITLISNSPDLQYETTQKLFDLVKEDITQQALSQVAAWCLGEYGELFNSTSDFSSQRLSEKIVQTLEKILNYNAGSVTTREYAINALMKLSIRFPDLSE